VVADKGSNQVSILLNQGSFTFTAGPRLNSGGTGPVSTVVGHFTGSPYPDLLVTNSQSNDVRLLPGVGQGFFNDQSPRVYAVGNSPVTSFVGNFNGQADLVTVNAGSNDLTLISGFEGPNSVTSTIPSGGVEPDAAFAFSSGSGFEDLVVGNAGDGTLALFAGGPDGLGLMSATTEPNLPDPTALAFSALTGGQVQFYAATAGREAAELVALSLGIETEATSQLTAAAPLNIVAQLVPLHESSLPLVATVLTLTIPVSGVELNLGLFEEEAVTVAAFLPGSGIAVGQGLSSPGRGGRAGADEAVQPDEPGASAAATATVIAPWERVVIGLDEALEQFRRQNPGGLSGAVGPSSSGDRSGPPMAPPAPVPGGPASMRSDPDRLPSGGEADQQVSSPAAGSEAVDTTIESLWGDDEEASWASERTPHPPFEHPLPARGARGKDLLRDEPFGDVEKTPHPPFGHPLPTSGAREKDAPEIRLSAGVGRDQLVIAPGEAPRSLIVAMLAVQWVHFHRSPRIARPIWSGRVGNSDPVRRRRAMILGPGWTRQRASQLPRRPARIHSSQLAGQDSLASQSCADQPGSTGSPNSLPHSPSTLRPRPSWKLCLESGW
jgi:hypothetical protein